MKNVVRKNDEPEEGDYYGVIYKGSLILPVVGLLLVVIGIALLVKKS